MGRQKQWWIALTYRTEQNRTEQKRTEQNRTEQNRTELNRTEQKMVQSAYGTVFHKGKIQQDATMYQNVIIPYLYEAQ